MVPKLSADMRFPWGFGPLLSARTGGSFGLRYESQRQFNSDQILKEVGTKKGQQKRLRKFRSRSRRLNCSAVGLFAAA